jgi:hypothetical protein
MIPDDICEKYSKQKINLNIEYKDDFIIISGNRNTLEFIGNLILAQAEYKKDNGFQISPNGAGKKFFTKTSKIGLYINRNK